MISKHKLILPSTYNKKVMKITYVNDFFIHKRTLFHGLHYVFFYVYTQDLDIFIYQKILVVLLQKTLL